MSTTAYKTGISLGAGVRYAWADWLSTQADLLYATRGSDVELDGDIIGTFYFTYLEFPLLARFRLPFHDNVVRPPFSVYALLGPSASILMSAESVDGAGRNKLDKDALHTFDFGLIGGLGVAWEITPQWVLSVEARYDQGFIEAFPDAPAGGPETKNRALLLTLGIDFTLRHGDSDRDRVADYRDRCPTEFEDQNDYQDDDGCPDDQLDTDNDGIVARKDTCPDKAEDMNGYQDDDGCPDGRLDKDGDGIFDGADKCDDKPFGFNKDVDLNNLPEALKELVPGCPPEVALVRVERDSGRNRDWLALASPLLFDYGEQEVKERHKDELNEVALLLAWYYPKMRLQVVGHADSKSNKPANVRERENVRHSLKRADNVRDYLLNQGIEDGRLVSVGRGDAEPVDQQSGDNPANRRVELIVIEMGPSNTVVSATREPR